ncbi:glycosyltransferase family 4 protein [Poseidonibacter parvus]|uniref:glycosyltransferase family 4 protein n=1 Tax=Poseidonibacter parvus TaxID=1850254 RepID=UPI0015603C35|nr:glycosyltransferase family 4 protein [Poseidonibacter parvus]
MKKIVFIHLLNDYSGSPKVLSQIVRNEVLNNSNIYLYTSKDDGFLSNITKNHFNFFYKRSNNKFFTLCTYILSQMDLFFKILKYKKEDMIYINTLLPFGAAMAARFKGCEIIYHIHETSIKPSVLKRFLRYVVSKTASKVIFVSNDLKSKESFENIKDEVIHNALEHNFLETASHYEYKYLHHDKFIVTMICSLKDYKGIPEFISICKKLEEQKDISFRLILNADQIEIDTYFNYDLPDNIEIFSRQKDLTKFYSNSSLVLNLSRVDQWVETFGLTIVEALAYGVPIICPPVGGPIEIVESDKEGYLISSYDIGKISNKILELSRDEDTCLRLSANGKEKVKSFSEKVFLEKIEKVIYE